MSTSTSLSLLEASHRVGKSKPTILRAIQAGKISATRDEPTGEWRIEPAELFRVYAPMPEGTSASVQEGDDDTPRTTSTSERNTLNFGNTRTDARTAAELEALKRELEREKEERGRERRQQEETIADLRKRLPDVLTNQRSADKGATPRPAWRIRLLSP